MATSFGSREAPFEKHFQSAGQENYLLCVYPRFNYFEN